MSFVCFSWFSSNSFEVAGYLLLSIRLTASAGTDVDTEDPARASKGPFRPVVTGDDGIIALPSFDPG